MGPCKGETYQLRDYFSWGGFFMGRHFNVTPAYGAKSGEPRQACKRLLLLLLLQLGRSDIKIN